MSWLLAILGFSALIVLHEAGHFVAAKATGMKVERFSLFFGPMPISIKRGETVYGIGTIPLGGYVKIAGMEWPGSERRSAARGKESEKDALEEPEEDDPSARPDPRGYFMQPVWKRLVVIGAGPAVNIVLAFVLLFFVGFDAREPTSTIESIKQGSPAAAAGLAPGDKIIAVDGRALSQTGTAARIEAFSGLIARHRCPGAHPFDGCQAATPALLRIERSGRRHTLVVYPRYDAQYKRTLIGFQFGSVAATHSASQAISYAWRQMWFVSSGTFKALAHIFESRERNQLSGVVGIGAVTHEAVNAGLAPALWMLGIISALLGLFNLLPLLPLDGGHIFWSLVEKLRGEPVPFRVIEGASAIGFVLVIMLFFIGLSNDVGRLTGEGFHVR